MNAPDVVAALEEYVREITVMRDRFRRGQNGIYMNSDDQPRYRQLVHEIADLLGDVMVNGSMVRVNFASIVNDGISGFVNSPSLHGVETVIAYIQSTITRLSRNPAAVKSALSTQTPAPPNKQIELERLIRRLPPIIHQLGKRQRGRSPFAVNDEYDLQDLFHALLAAIFDDIRPEEHTPSHASSASRLDFYLPEIAAVVELKMMRQGMTTRDAANQLIIDIARYQAFPGCNTLFCVVWDPSRDIKNPRGFENDLMAPQRTLKLTAVILS